MSGEAGVVVAANPARVLLLTGVAITAWLVHLALSAAAVPLSCTWASTWPLHLVTVLTLAVAVACALVVTAGRRGRRRASNGVGAFYTTAGALLCWLSVALIIAEYVPVLRLGPCPL